MLVGVLVGTKAPQSIAAYQVFTIARYSLVPYLNLLTPILVPSSFSFRAIGQYVPDWDKVPRILPQSYRFRGHDFLQMEHLQHNCFCYRAFDP